MSRDRWFALLLALPLLVLGGLIVLSAMGFDFMKPLVPRWVVGLAGSIFVILGIGFALGALGVETAGFGNWFWSYMALVLLVVFNWSVLVGDLRGWTGDGLFDLLSPGEVARVVVVTIDLLILTWGIDRTAGRIRGTESPILGWIGTLGGGGKKAAAVAVLAAPLAVAIALHATGVLDRVGAAFGQPKAEAKHRP